MLKINRIIRLLMIVVAVSVLWACSQEVQGPQTIPVTISVLVLHKGGFSFEEFFPTEGAWVELFNGDGSPIDPQRLFKQETNAEGKAIFNENNNVFLPTASYRIRVSYFNSRTVTDYFTMPQFPNLGTEYLVERTVYHNIGDSLYTPTRVVRIITEVTEKDVNTGQFLPSVNALVSILKPDGSPILPDFTYEKLTDSNGIAEIIANDFYLIPGMSYKARVEKSGFTSLEVPFQIPTTPNYENNYLIHLQVQLMG